MDTMEAVEKIKRRVHTDAERKVLRVDASQFLGGYFLDIEQFEKDIKKHGAPAEQEAYAMAPSFFDGIRPYLLSHKKPMPMIYDLRRGAYGAVIGYVNAGANDFNNEENGICPSIIVANAFSMPRTPEGKTDANDLLYIYRGLSKNSKGLNWDLIRAYEAKNPDKKISETLAKMDMLAAMPEAERFAPKPEAPQKVNFWKRLMGGRRS